MGTNTLSVATPGQDIPADHHNELVQAFLQEIVPRNASRAPTDLAGNLGTSVLRFLRAFVENYHIGTASNNLKIYEGAAGEIWIERGGTNNEIIKLRNGNIELWKNGANRFSVGATGIVWASQTDKSIPRIKLANNAFEQSAIQNHSTNDFDYETITSFSHTFQPNRNYMVALLGAGISGNGRIRLSVGSDELEEWPFTLRQSLTFGSESEMVSFKVPCNIMDSYVHGSSQQTLTVKAEIRASSVEGVSVDDVRLMVWEI